MTEEISENVGKVKRNSPKEMAIVLTLDKEVTRITCAYGPQSKRPDREKVRFYDEMASEWRRRHAKAREHVLTLLTVDYSARESMKDAAKCEN